MKKIKSQFNIGKNNIIFYRKFCKILLNSIISLLKIYKNSLNQNNSINQQSNTDKIDENVLYNLYAIKSILNNNPSEGNIKNEIINCEKDEEINKIDDVIIKMFNSILSSKNNLKNKNKSEIKNEYDIKIINLDNCKNFNENYKNDKNKTHTKRNNKNIKNKRNNTTKIHSNSDYRSNNKASNLYSSRYQFKFEKLVKSKVYSFKYSSCYNNINVITKGKYIKNKILREQTENFLENNLKNATKRKGLIDFILKKNNFFGKKENKNNNKNSNNNNQNNSNNNSTLNQLFLDSSKVNIFLEEQIKKKPDDNDNNLDIIKSLNKRDMNEREVFNINSNNNINNGLLNISNDAKSKDFMDRDVTLSKQSFKEKLYKKKPKRKKSPNIKKK